ncbi:hypothetical protein Gorai_000741, partial [Gossypium raimondii]|nr:hypothetical protein [Gossypium raimondii]
AKGLLKKGLCWRIRSRDQVLVWEDACVPSAVDFKIQTRANDQHKCYVSDLINQIANCWKEGLIKATFNEQEVDRILCIPLPCAPQEDTLVW